MNANPVALKEWASAIRALKEGRQIMLMRKGGIAEETKRFELKSHSFYLYPTYEHQRPELLKEQYRHLVGDTLGEMDANAAEIGLTAYAEAVHDLEIHDLEQLELLYPYHIWSEGLAAERLRWKAKEPLHVLLLRVYVPESPVSVEILPEYSGCRSWIELGAPPESGSLRPVLDDETFNRKVADILSALGR
ncbi:hypothetical protein C2I18_21390 [Paenibacillus sp. PK3_47]|uniref:DUF1802 family protein n=1 Tax=Paenibacillus sp. PK3_47 TaxID=2072642 RepID=UPI00201DF651|nr:DUF1802 family protein [Paenibacillus sp. PK3_47]UQZ35860.1 hypothetical protein C2I18_21390 [Paenibacillus sp. PK3_47]